MVKNWEQLEADENLILDTHYSPGREGRSVSKVVLHHNGGNLSIRGCYDVWQTRRASAHYQVDTNGRVGQLVWDADTAWHAGDWETNLSSIGIEHADMSTNPWRISDACLDNGAHLTAAICRYFKLGRPQYGKNVFFHKDFSATECPASIAGSQRDAYLRRAQEWYDRMNGAPVASKPTAAKPAPAAPAKKSVETVAREVIAGQWGNGDDRMNRLRQAGYDANAVQQRVNALLGVSTPQPSVDLNALATRVINGEFGNGEQRKAALGVNYAAVQAIVNKRLGY